MTVQRMEHVGIVVDDLAAATAFFVELGLELQGGGPVEGGWMDRVVGLEGVRAEIAMVQTPDGHGRLERVADVAAAPADRRALAWVCTAGTRWDAARLGTTSVGSC
jgi:catechol 2,3-dioxygenase-like lactoylglutathione lyase family enzyme